MDNLLRLVGESIILTGQVQERIRKTIDQTRAVAAQNRLFQSLTAELEQLVDVRNVSSPLSKSIQRGDFDPWNWNSTTNSTPSLTGWWKPPSTPAR